MHQYFYTELFHMDNSEYFLLQGILYPYSFCICFHSLMWLNNVNADLGTQDVNPWFKGLHFEWHQTYD